MMLGIYRHYRHIRDFDHLSRLGATRMGFGASRNGGALRGKGGGGSRSPNGQSKSQPQKSRQTQNNNGQSGPEKRQQSRSRSPYAGLRQSRGRRAY